MKHNIVFVFLAFLGLSCSSQIEQPNKTEITEGEKKEIKEPKGSWRVNKEFDEQGNLTRFDSIYSWSYSEIPPEMNTDSVYNHVQSMIQKRFSMIPSPRMNGFTKHDSIYNHFFPKDFFKDDYFLNDTPFGNQNMEAIMERMEAMRRQFFNDDRRYIIPPAQDNRRKHQSLKGDNKQV